MDGDRDRLSFNNNKGILVGIVEEGLKSSKSVTMSLVESIEYAEFVGNVLV